MPHEFKIWQKQKEVTSKSSNKDRWKTELVPRQFYQSSKHDKNYSWSIWLNFNWAASSEFCTYRLCEQRRFRRACASAQSRQNLRCSLIQAVGQEEPSDRKPDPWPLWMAGHAQLKFVMTDCSKTQIRLTRPNLCLFFLSAYNSFFIVGLILSMQIPFVGFNPISTSEHMASAGNTLNQY